RRTLVFVPDKNGEPASEVRYDNVLWKSDCYLNPNRPQFGTWEFSRAGWAPGDVVRPWWIDLTPHLVPGQAAELRYEPEPYDFSGVPENRQPTDAEINRARQLVRAYLILYRSPKQLTPAPTLRVIGVEADSNAAKSGLLAGDYLAYYDHSRPLSIDGLRAAIQAAQAAGKEQIRLVIYRDSERLEKTLEPGRMGVKLVEY
ncbi:MAG TPA: peptide-N-glycosidase F-related protein, partial [Geothermobacteraceae bacterium]|nr:peptide-N-glycosidase F-related protein [Geothermobacteraceae bacterium]